MIIKTPVIYLKNDSNEDNKIKVPENDVTADQSNNSSSLAFNTDELKQLSFEAHNDKSVSQNITNLAKDSNSQIITQDYTSISK